MTENDQGSAEDKIENGINYEKQIFDELDVNPYEIVVAVARAAREINDKAQKFLGPEVEIRPTNMALKKMSMEKAKFVYDEPNSESKETTDGLK